MMLGKPVRMKCGHIGDTIARLPYNGEIATVVACSFCVNDNGTVNQPAVSIDKIYNTQPPLPKIQRNYALPVLGVIAVLITIIAAIASL